MIRAFVDAFGELRVVRLSEMGFEEQVELFAGARLVLGPHGQAFRHTLFTDDAVVVQFAPGSVDGSLGRHYWCDVYDALGPVAGSRTLTLFSGTRSGAEGHWEFPLEDFRAQLATLRESVR